MFFPAFVVIEHGCDGPAFIWVTVSPPTNAAAAEVNNNNHNYVSQLIDEMTDFYEAKHGGEDIVVQNGIDDGGDLKSYRLNDVAVGRCVAARTMIKGKVSWVRARVTGKSELS